MKYLVFDTETTGLTVHPLLGVDKQPYIIEFCGCLLTDTGQETWHSWLIKPPIPIPEEAQTITGITDEMVKDAPTFCQVAEDITKLIESADALVAHNLAFDRDVLTYEFDRCGVRPRWPQHMICTVEMTHFMKSRRMSLGELHEELFGQPHPEAHRACPDVKALVAVFKDLMGIR